MRLPRPLRASEPPTARRAAAARQALIDAAFDAYLDWRDESRSVARLYRRWSQAPRGRRAVCFAAYAAALEREQHAARIYAALLRSAVEG